MSIQLAQNILFIVRNMILKCYGDTKLYDIGWVTSVYNMFTCFTILMGFYSFCDCSTPEKPPPNASSVRFLIIQSAKHNELHNDLSDCRELFCKVIFLFIF